VTLNLPFEDWTGVFGVEWLTGALLDPLTHHVHILEMNGGSYRLEQSRARRREGGKQAGSDPAYGLEISGTDDRRYQPHHVRHAIAQWPGFAPPLTLV